MREFNLSDHLEGRLKREKRCKTHKILLGVGLLPIFILSGVIINPVFFVIGGLIFLLLLVWASISSEADVIRLDRGCGSFHPPGSRAFL